MGRSGSGLQSLRNPKYVRKLLISVAVLVGLFVASGYRLSDNYFFKNVIRENQITTPEDAFAFVEHNTNPASFEMNLTLQRTPRNMLTKQKYLFCDQGSILMANIVNQLGYKTRLVDLVGDDDVSHHTILEVYQGNKWKTYDTLHNLQDVTYQHSAQAEAPELYTRRVEPRYRTYPRFVNRVIQNNFYIQRVALWLTGAAS